MNIQNFKYNKELIKTKIKLERELRIATNELKKIQRDNCDHIKVCLGSKPLRFCGDTSISQCLLCQEVEPYTRFETVEARYYKMPVYGYGEEEKDREERLLELQNITLKIMEENPSITEEELVKKLNQIMENDKEETKELSKKYEFNYKF